MKIAVRGLMVLTLVIHMAASPVLARDLVASLAQLPGHSELGANGVPQGGFVDLIGALNAKYQEGEIEIGIYPFKRSIGNVISGRADFHLPLVRSPLINDLELPYRYVSEPITRVAFVVYSLSDSELIRNFDTMDNLSVATIHGHSDLFPFQIRELASIQVALKMLAAGRDVDAVILEQEAADGFIREHKMKGIQRQLYRYLDSSVVISSREDMEELDQLLSRLLREIKAEPLSKQLIDTIHRPYDNWQPGDMGW